MHALFSFTVSSVSDIFGVSIMFGLVAWIGMFLKEIRSRACGSHESYRLFGELKFI